VLALEREVGLEAEHDGALLEVADRANLANVLDDQLVRLANICMQKGRVSAEGRR